MTKSGLAILLLALLLIPYPARAEDEKPVAVELELDAYYSNLGLYISLTDSPIPQATSQEKIDIFRNLLLSSLAPRFLVVEASVNPLPCLGLFIKNNYPEFYDDTQSSEELNLIKAATAGFEEPYALSFFLGDVVNFTKPGETCLVSNKGYIGYLLSVGNYHIKDNTAISDNWLEMEWKIKGDYKNEQQNLSWSIRGGVKLHNHPEISDTVYISYRRSRIDYEEKKWSWLRNSGFENTIAFDTRNFHMVENTFYVSKKWPVKKKATLSLDIGFIYDHNKYYGTLEDQNTDGNFTFLVQPNLEF